jgi:hypothetical protein
VEVADLSGALFSATNIFDQAKLKTLAPTLRRIQKITKNKK